VTLSTYSNKITWLAVEYPNINENPKVATNAMFFKEEDLTYNNKPWRLCGFARIFLLPSRKLLTAENAKNTQSFAKNVLQINIPIYVVSLCLP
jgi:hypothetical protein